MEQSVLRDTELCVLRDLLLSFLKARLSILKNGINCVMLDIEWRSRSGNAYFVVFSLVFGSCQKHRKPAVLDIFSDDITYHVN